MRKKAQKFRIVSVSPTDGFYNAKKEFIGRTCTIDDPLGLVRYIKNNWVNGVVLVVRNTKYMPKQTFFFLKVRLLKI